MKTFTLSQIVGSSYLTTQSFNSVLHYKGNFMAIKKAFEEIVALLENHKGSKVSSIMDQVYLLCEAKKIDSTHLCDKDGNIVAIFCYYHKQWELVSETPYGSKANSATKLNTMCKVGTSKWTKAQRDAAKAKAQMLEDVASGKVAPSDIVKLSEDIEAQRKTIDMTDAPKGYTLEEVQQFI